MAKQGGPFIFEFTHGLVSWYRVGDVGLVRMKSNLTRKRWKTDPAFARSRTCAANLATASKMASPLYKSLPVEKRKVHQFRKLLGLGNELLSAGFSIEQAQKVMELATENLRKTLEQPKKESPAVRKPPQINQPAIVDLSVVRLPPPYYSHHRRPFLFYEKQRFKNEPRSLFHWSLIVSPITYHLRPVI
jgi:hypothetical protein